MCDLQADLDAAQSKLSFHLKVLKDAGLVTDRREGRWSYYTIVPQALAEVHDLAVALQPKPAPRAPSGPAPREAPGKRGLPGLPVLRAGRCCG